MTQDLKTALNHLKKDENLREIIETTTLPESSKTSDLYFDLVQSIVSQQLSIKAAATIFDRFLDLFEGRYPIMEQVITRDISEFRNAGVSRQKASYIQNVAQFFIENDLENKDWSFYSDKEVIDLLTQIKGVGVWTVRMILMSSLRRPDILPVGDLGIQQAFIKLFDLDLDTKALKKEMVILSEPWRPYRTLACRYLWAWKDE